MTNINQEIESALTRNFEGPFRFLLAVSGGPDSQVLIKAFSHVAKKLGHTVSALGVNHGLRPEADSELDLAAALCEKEGIKFFRERIQVARGRNLQARARDARYEVLFRKAFEIGANLVTGHHLDDAVETVLMRIFRNGRISSLAVLPEMQYIPYQDTHFGLFRPMLKISRHDILGYAKRWELKSAQDPSNQDNHYERCWVRNILLPMISERHPDISKKLISLQCDAFEYDRMQKVRENIISYKIPGVRKESLEHLFYFTQSMAERECDYGDFCPDFSGTRHGTCDSCKARRALDKYKMG